MPISTVPQFKTAEYGLPLRAGCSNGKPFGHERVSARQRSSAVEVLGSTGRWFSGFGLLGFGPDGLASIRSSRTGAVRRLPANQWRNPVLPSSTRTSRVLLPIEPDARPAPPDPEPAPSAWPGKVLPPGTRPASSAKPCHAAAVASEVAVIWTPQPPGTPRPPWVREIFPVREPNPADCQRHGEFTRAYTVDGDGEIVRAFLVSDRTLNAYAELQLQRRGTCPIEAVDTGSLEVGKAAYPADPGLRERLGFARYEAGPFS